ncbi:hypothetical protein LCP9604111_9091 [Penicillium roqueforti]|uniref:uncharacterized protein n=1 Tax=Penicillium roqueforti TaxID=5082 RepID=UPI00190A2EED|nr:uncharacterized protein LCP9604111_9091 [Penicillium roqueforti]KAF9239549.1 hypothetical protein LCP9604111_9091 [Penicillium roqueforti]KAI3116898.1 hypothetical protein CBS147330_9589 [Penicillium roqueforti]
MVCGQYRVLSLGVGLNLAPYSMTQYIIHNKMPKHPDLQAVDCDGYVHAEGTIKLEQDLHVLREKPLSSDIKVAAKKKPYLKVVYDLSRRCRFVPAKMSDISSDDLPLSTASVVASSIPPAPTTSLQPGATWMTTLGETLPANTTTVALLDEFLIDSCERAVDIAIHNICARLVWSHSSTSNTCTNFNMRFSLSSLGLGPLYASMLSLYSGQESSSVTHHPVLPPSYPLAVRNPFLSAWMPSDRVQQLPYAEPQFWAGQELGWSVIVRVNGQAYSLMGVPDMGVSNIRPATVRRAEFTATHSIFDLTAGPVAFKLDFLSPVSPSNYVRQSLPFSYLTVQVAESRGHEIQIYSDIDARWTGGKSHSQRDFEEQDGLAIYSLTVEDAPLYAEADDMALWGSAILASRSSSLSQLTALSGSPEDVRRLFGEDGKLSGEDDTWAEGSVVALAHNLGNVTGGHSVNFVVGYEREAAINYLGEAYTGFYRAEYPTTSSALSFFLDDYSNALLESLKLDRELVALSSAAAGPKYADILALSTRQAYGGIDLVIPNDSLDTGEVLAFIKELSSNGNTNTIDVIMPAFPIYYVMDPDYIRLLLEPIMKYLAAGRWHLPYTIHDLGTHYPHAIGHDDQKAEPMPIEECGNLLILAAAYVRATGDTDWSAHYMEVFQKYANYLLENSVNIANQLSSNDAAGPLANETNLAIKAAVGLKAFGEMSGDGVYSRAGDQHANIFFQQGLGTDKDQTHFVLEYPDWPGTWKTPYNLFPDVLLGLNTFTDSAYQMGSNFFTSVRGEYGVPLDNRQDWAKSDWNMWLAGTFETSTRDEFVDDLWSFMTNGKHNWPFSDRYVATSAHGNEPGVPILCRARPTVGGHFALLALKGPRSIQSLSCRRGAVLEPVGEMVDRQQYLFGNHIKEL